MKSCTKPDHSSAGSAEITLDRGLHENNIRLAEHPESRQQRNKERKKPALDQHAVKCKRNRMEKLECHEDERGCKGNTGNLIPFVVNLVELP